jgi:hypothetical protein
MQHLQWFNPLKQVEPKGASDIIIFFAESCLSELGTVLKEPSAI